jgi:hypothetical protein
MAAIQQHPNVKYVEKWLLKPETYTNTTLGLRWICFTVKDFEAVIKLNTV